jgi:Ca-activated chloride channel family protein
VTALAAALLLALSPLTAEEPNVREGNEKLLAGDAAEALRRYDAAERALGPRAELDYDRGNALYRLGRPAEARDAWRRSLERGAGSLSSRALQNVGNALEATGDRDGAIAAFTEALRKDPGNEDARFDLEVLLRRKAEGRDPRRDPGERGARKDDPRDQPPRDAGAKPAPGEASRGKPPASAERDAGAEARPAPQRAQDPTGSSPRDGRAPAAGADPKPAPEQLGEQQGAGARTAPLPRQDAEKLLDALRARERNMPLSGTERGSGRRADAAKDW